MSTKKELIKYRINKSWDIFQEAEILFKARKKSGTINRLYYSLFNMIIAILLLKDIHVKTHKGIYLKFSQFFIKTGIFSIELSKLFNTLLSYRQNADYENFQDIDLAEVELLKNRTKLALEELENYIRQNMDKT